MSDLLEQANAALRLGDWFVPPMGSVFVSDSYQFTRYRVVASRLLEDLGRADTFFGEAINKSGGLRLTGAIHYDRVQMATHHRFTLLEIPEDSPPFDKWRRPPK